MFRMFAHSELGPRDEQQDAFAFATHAAVIADGMGGHPGGAEAAQTAVRAVMEELSGEPEEHDLESAVRWACMEVPGASPGGTTVVVLSLRETADGAVARLAWVGDSRAYVVRDGEAELLTDDHVAPDGGLDRWVPDEGIPDLTELELSHGDALVLCTDGVWNVLDEEMIAELVADPGGDPAETLVSYAIDEGAGDNCTALVCYV